MTGTQIILRIYMNWWLFSINYNHIIIKHLNSIRFAEEPVIIDNWKITLDINSSKYYWNA